MGTVRFRGLMLFRTESGKVVEAVFPRTVPEEGADGLGRQLKKQTSRHYAGIVHSREGKKKEKRYDLTGASVWFAGGTERIDKRTIEELPDLTNILPSVSLLFHESAECVTRVNMTIPIGHIVASTRPGQDFALSNDAAKKRLAFTVDISFSMPVALQFVAPGGKLRTIVVQGDDVAIVYHYDDAKPNKTNLESEREIEPGVDSLVDEDFKWLYTLVRPVDKNSAMPGTPADLPAPKWERAPGPAVTPSVSTCFPGRIGD